jgi:AraC-like DNA-binding protein
METTTVRTTEHELSHPDAIERFLALAYGTSVRVRGAGDRRLLRHRRHDVGPYAIEAAYQSDDLELEMEPLQRILVTRTSTSRLERTSNGFHRCYDVGELFFMSEPERSCKARWLPGEIQNCMIDPVLLARVACAAPARRPEPIRFTSLDPQTPAGAAHWWATRSYVAGLLTNPEAAAPLLIANAGQLLAAATLATFPNTAVTDPTVEDRHDAHPGTLRRAIAFIEEHAQQDVAVADIAAAAHVSVRAIQLAFRRHLDTTPVQYLRRTRLSRVHDELRKADPATTTVTAVAGRWGFYNPSRFTALYRQAYDITPSQTLRQHR